METVYLVCAILGGTLMLGQFVLSLLGIGHDVDHDLGGHDGAGTTDHGSSWFAGVLSLRAITAAIMLFGLCGLLAQSWNKDGPTTLAYAGLGGVAGMLLVAQLMKFLHGLSAEGNVRIEQSVGEAATVYLTIPGKRSSAGKVQLRLQDRTVEYQAITAHPDPLPTGSQVMVVGVINSDTLEVTPGSLVEAKS